MDYSKIMDGLYDMPGQIAHIEYRLGELRLELKHLRQSLDERQAEIAMSREAKAWGSNEEERNLAKAAAYRFDSVCRGLTEKIDDAEADMMSEDVSLTRDKNLFYAFRSMAELHAAYLLCGRSVAANGNGNAIADELGL